VLDSDSAEPLNRANGIATPDSALSTSPSSNLEDEDGEHGLKEHSNEDLNELVYEIVEEKIEQLAEKITEAEAEIGTQEAVVLANINPPEGGADAGKEKEVRDKGGK
jgi:Glu-tRNA(Gln) amidotransferase subunit E-like FAD-binding protein